MMWKRLFIAMLGAAVLGSGGAARANTGYGQDEAIALDDAPGRVAGMVAQESPGATGATLFIYDDDTASHASLENVYGGYATSGASAYGNVVTMNGGKVTQLLAGGYSSGGQALDNLVEASDNTVEVTGGAVPGQITGGYAVGTALRWANADRNTVTISGSTTVEEVYGGYATNGHAYNNSVSLGGGQVAKRLVGGASIWEGDVGGNTAIVTGGTAIEVCGAFFSNAREVKGNKVIITGGSVETAHAYSQHTTKVEYGDNVIIMSGGTAGALLCAERIHLAGAGFSGSIEGVAGIAGQALECGSVGTCDSIDLYGTQISGTGLTARNALNFHLVDGLPAGAAPMVTLSGGLNLAQGLELTFDALGSMEWQPGDSVTLVSAALGIAIDASLLAREYKIYRNGHPGEVAGTAALELEQGGTVLRLVVQGSVPEPAGGAQCLLALAVLAARRRVRIPENARGD